MALSSVVSSPLLAVKGTSLQSALDFSSVPAGDAEMTCLLDAKKITRENVEKFRKLMFLKNNSYK